MNAPGCPATVLATVFIAIGVLFVVGAVLAVSKAPPTKEPFFFDTCDASKLANMRWADGGPLGGFGIGLTCTAPDGGTPDPSAPPSAPPSSDACGCPPSASGSGSGSGGGSGGGGTFGTPLLDQLLQRPRFMNIIDDTKFAEISIKAS